MNGQTDLYKTRDVVNTYLNQLMSLLKIRLQTLPPSQRSSLEIANNNDNNNDDDNNNNNDNNDNNDDDNNNNNNNNNNNSVFLYVLFLSIRAQRPRQENQKISHTGLHNETTDKK